MVLNLIEAGCGTEIITSKMASLGYNVTGIDINTKILNLAKELEYEYFNTNRTQFLNKSIFKLDYPKNNFDLCFSCGVLEHFEDEKIINSINNNYIFLNYYNSNSNKMV